MIGGVESRMIAGGGSCSWRGLKARGGLRRFAECWYFYGLAPARYLSSKCEGGGDKTRVLAGCYCFRIGLNSETFWSTIFLFRSCIDGLPADSYWFERASCTCFLIASILNSRSSRWVFKTGISAAAFLSLLLSCLLLLNCFIILYVSLYHDRLPYAFGK